MLSNIDISQLKSDDDDHKDDMIGELDFINEAGLPLTFGQPVLSYKKPSVSCLSLDNETNIVSSGLFLFLIIYFILYILIYIFIFLDSVKAGYEWSSLAGKYIFTGIGLKEAGIPSKQQISDARIMAYGRQEDVDFILRFPNIGADGRRYRRCEAPHHHFYKDGACVGREGVWIESMKGKGQWDDSNYNSNYSDAR